MDAKFQELDRNVKIAIFTSNVRHIHGNFYNVAKFLLNNRPDFYIKLAHKADNKRSRGFGDARCLELGVESSQRIVRRGWGTAIKERMSRRCNEHTPSSFRAVDEPFEELEKSVAVSLTGAGESYSTYNTSVGMTKICHAVVLWLKTAISEVTACKGVSEKKGSANNS
ncbi:hypothetical protein BDN70DRAFT_897777 [Pholiota conissans]|uniref:Uncharacterized protein n=1 Tax=Pholiota conissans TaxID=109636 RepID=A0A9P5YU91_9AGAR|nr:hypothetical protein BDN70DRAFT_897777 [Pholiota conissans]